MLPLINCKLKRKVQIGIRLVGLARSNVRPLCGEAGSRTARRTPDRIRASLGESSLMVRRAGSADLLLHAGHVRAWLGQRMARLG